MKRVLSIVLPVAMVSMAPLAAAPTATETYFTELGTEANLTLAKQGSDLRIGAIEWITESHEVGSTVFFSNVGNKRLADDWVPFDPRRVASAAGGITYIVDLSDGATTSGLTAAQTDAAIDSAMDTWDFATQCSNLPIFELPDTGVDPDFVDFFFGFGPAPGPDYPYSDIVHAGWTTFFPPPTLGVTFTLIWVDGGGNPTDIDNDGQNDVAIREIYYNDLFSWAIDANIDVETVALHEAGHGLSQAHFGTLFQTDANGKFHFAPLAVMNAGYTQVQQELKPTDLAGHCSNWGGWPNN